MTLILYTMPSSSDSFAMSGGSGRKYHIYQSFSNSLCLGEQESLIYPRSPVKTTLYFKFGSFSCHDHLMVILMVVVWGKASFSIYDTCPFRPLHCCTTPLPPFHVQVCEALLGWEEGTCIPCVNFKCGSFTFLSSRPCSC